MTWADGIGVITLADGRRVRGRGLRAPLPAGEQPEFGLCLLGHPPPPMPWNVRWLKCRDFWVPADRADARAAFEEAFERCATERVEVNCAGGLGRTGTALACLAVLAGTPPDDAVAFVRAEYQPRAVEMPWQRRYVRTFRP